MFGKLNKSGWNPNLHMVANGIGMMGGAPSNSSLLQLGAQAKKMRAQREKQQQFAQMMQDPKNAGMLPKSVQGMAQFLDPGTAAKLATSYAMQREKGPALTTMQKNYRASQNDPEFAKFMAGRKPGMNVTVNAGDKQGQKKAADFIFENAEKAQKSRTNLNRYAVLGELLKNPNVTTGKGGPAVLELKKIAQMFGVKVDGVGVGEQIKQLSNKAALALKDNLPGPMSDSDRKFLMKLPPGLHNTPEGNRLIIGMARLSEQYKLERSEAVVKYGKPDMGVLSAARQVDEKYAGLFAKHVQTMRSLPKAPPRSLMAGVRSAFNPATGKRVYLRNGKWVDK